MSTTTLTIDLATSDASPSANYDTGQFTKLNSYSSSIPTTFDSYIQRGYDDRWAGISYNTYYGRYSFYHAYFRFVNVGVPQGSTISSAYLILEVPASPAGYPASDGDTFRIAGYDSDDVSQPSTGSDGAHSLHTSATVDGWQLRSDEGITTSPDIKTIIQEIVDRAGWSSGNDMMLMVWQPTVQSSTYRRYYNTGRDSDDTAPQLEITYESGGGGSSGTTKTKTFNLVQGMGSKFNLITEI